MSDQPELITIPLLDDDPSTSFNFPQTSSINIVDPDVQNWEYQKDTCRICLEEDQTEKLFSPCRCSGSSKYVHIDCLNEWRATSNNPEAFNRCFTCNYTYQTKVTEKELGCCGKFNFGQPKYYCGFYLINFLSIFVLGVILQILDPNRDIPKFFNKYLNPFKIISSHHTNITSTSNITTTSIPATPTPTSNAFSFFDYYAMASYIYLIIILLVFGIALMRVKNRKLYLKYLLGGPWYIALIRLSCLFGLTALCLTTNTMLGCFVMTCLIQVLVRHHYNYLNYLYRASESVILPYNPVGDHQRMDSQV